MGGKTPMVNEEVRCNSTNYCGGVTKVQSARGSKTIHTKNSPGLTSEWDTKNNTTQNCLNTQEGA